MSEQQKKEQEKDLGAELIHPVASPLAETLPRPTYELLLLGALRQTCDAEPSGVPCTVCGKSSLMHAFNKLLGEKYREIARLREIANRNGFAALIAARDAK